MFSSDARDRNLPCTTFRGSVCGKNLFKNVRQVAEKAAGQLSGGIESSTVLCSRTNGWASGVAPCSSRRRAVPGTAFRGHEDWANTKAATRFLDNDRVNEADSLAGHLEPTADHAAAIEGPPLVLPGTTDFSYQREDSEAIGQTGIIRGVADKKGWPRPHTVCGILMHASLGVPPEGLPLGRLGSRSGPGRHSQARTP